MPRPKKEVIVTPEQFVAAMAEKQCPKVEIASRLGISIDTFDRRYAELYATSKEGGKSKLREKLWAMAMAGDNRVIIFLAKNLLGMSDKVSTELSGPNGNPVQIDDARAKLASAIAGISARTAASSDPEPAQ